MLQGRSSGLPDPPTACVKGPIAANVACAQDCLANPMTSTPSLRRGLSLQINTKFDRVQFAIHART